MAQQIAFFYQSITVKLEGWVLKLNSNTGATWHEQQTHWKRPWCWERLKREEKRVTKDEIGGWMTSPIQWTWSLANSGRWWGTGRHGVLQSMGLQKVGLTWQLNNNENSCEKDIVDEMCDPLEFNGKKGTRNS